MNRFYDLFTRNTERDVVFILSEQRHSMTAALDLEMKHRLDHVLVNDTEPTIYAPFFFADILVNAMILKIKLETKHIFSML